MVCVPEKIRRQRKRSNLTASPMMKASSNLANSTSGSIAGISYQCLRTHFEPSPDNLLLRKSRKPIHPLKLVMDVWYQVKTIKLIHGYVIIRLTNFLIIQRNFWPRVLRMKELLDYKGVPSNATIKEERIKCGKSCLICPHGPYYYAY